MEKMYWIAGPSGPCIPFAELKTQMQAIANTSQFGKPQICKDVILSF